VSDLRGRTLFVSGGSRGIGLAIAVRAARDGANVAILAKTATPDPRLPGTIYTAAEEIEAAGGSALPLVGDLRDEERVAEAVREAAERFGGIDVCVNNASAINLSGTAALPVKRFDLMQSINSRGTFVLTQACLPYLRESGNAHVLTMSPPLNLAPSWLGRHPGYTLAKYGMTLLTLGFAAELRGDGIAANCLWPRTLIATAAVRNLLGGDEALATARRPEIVADAAHAVVSQPAADCTGNCFVDDEVLLAHGVSDLERYRFAAGDGPLALDIYVDEPAPRA
jgi:citronellol/citronellal dehydrogenase